MGWTIFVCAFVTDMLAPYRYFTDSFVNHIHAYNYDDGKLSDRRVFINSIEQGLPEGTYPDGLCVDSEGGIWSARFVFFCHRHTR